MKRYLIPLILLLLLGCVGSKPRLSASFLPASPAHPYEGDEVTLSVNVANSAAAEAKEFTVEFLANNVSLKTEVVTLPPNSNQTVSFSWFPYSAGEYNIVARVDSGNQVSDASADKESTIHISVLPAKGESIFSVLPKGRLENVGIINETSQGITALYTYMPAIQVLSNPAYISLLSPYLKNVKELHIGTADYASGIHAIVISIRGATSSDELSTILSTIIKLGTNLNSIVQRKTLNGTDVSIFTSDGLPAPVCIWRDKGWSKLTMYIDPITLETCDSMFGGYDSSYADKPLSIASEFARSPPFNATLLEETLQISNLTNTTVYHYGATFGDAEGFYGFYVVKDPYTPINNTCVGRILNSSSMQVCETPPLNNSTLARALRKVGNYTAACLSTPKTGELTASVEEKAIDLCYSLNYPGEEGTWVNILSLLHQTRCELPDNFSCLSYEFGNATLKLNLAQNTGRTIVLNGFGCSSLSNASAASFRLAQPITIPSNSSVMLTSKCYDEVGGVIQDTYTYFDTRLYLNYSIQGSESKAVVGNLTIRKI